MKQTDTSEQAEEVMVDIYRRMSVADKLKRIFQAYEMGKTLAMAGLRQLHPNASEKQIWYLWARQHLGEELFKKAYGESADE